MEILISGSSTGIGRATAVHLARKGHSVWAGVRSQKSFDEIQRLNVDGLKPVFLDVCIDKSIVEGVRHIIKTSGQLDALVNNAGIAVGGPLEAVPMAEWRKQFDANVFGLIRLLQECLPALREARGRVVNISSVSGRVAMPFMSPYSASKFAVEALSDSLRRELKSHGVKVAVVEPGAIATPIWEKGQQDSLRTVNSFSKEMQEVYGPSLQRFTKRLEKIVHRAEPVALVVKAIEHALTSKHPRSRYPVGRGIGVLTALSGALPDTWMDRIVEMRR